MCIYIYIYIHTYVKGADASEVQDRAGRDCQARGEPRSIIISSIIRALLVVLLFLCFLLL